LEFNENKILISKYNDLNGYFATIKLPLGGTLAEFFKEDKINVDAVVSNCKMYGTSLFPMTKDVIALLRSKIKEGKRVLIEGTQGAFLDIEHGTYPYVTAGLTTRPGLEHDAGLNIDLCINVVKAYATRVGNGPFPTEILDDDFANKLRDAGNEYGSTTGRPRRVGWLDILALKHALELNSRKNEKKYLAVTKLDVLRGFNPIICEEYRINGKSIKECVMEGATMGQCRIFKTIEDIRNTTKFVGLPESARAYIAAIEEMAGAEVLVLGNGPGRDDLIVRE